MNEASDAAENGPEPRSVLRNVVYAPIGGQGLVQQTVRRLAEAIRLGLLEEGERLPPEAQLSRWLGISAMTLREALAILREGGLLETRRGRGGGTFVRKPPSTPGDAELQIGIEGNADFLQDLTDYRKAVAGEAAALAAERATARDVSVLLDHAEKVVNADQLHAYLQADGVFHIYVAEISGSSRLLVSTTSIEMELNRIAESLLASMDSPQALAGALSREHSQLVKAIADGDAARAREIMHSHADGGLDFLMALRPEEAASAAK